MKKIMLSIQSSWLMKILNGQKKMEIRKSIPRFDAFVAYLYCTQAMPYLCQETDEHGLQTYYLSDNPMDAATALNGKVVGEILINAIHRQIHIRQDYFELNEVLRLSCLSKDEYESYSKGAPCYGWPIVGCREYVDPKLLSDYGLTDAPQSWCYISN